MLRGTVAIVGRPNVGKSTLFNRLTRSDRALVDDRPGVTRDRLIGTVEGDDEYPGFLVIDTGGFETDDFNFQPFQEGIVWRQTEAAIAESDLVLLVLDGKAGPNPHDEVLLRRLEKDGKPYLAVVNKIDGIEARADTWEFYSIGLESWLTISAAHNRGVGELRERIQDELERLSAERVAGDDPEATRVAIIGRPNVGKSSMLNRLIGEERSLVSNVAGTTRDTVDSPITYNKKKYVLVDTAGIRRKSKVKDKLESLSVLRSVRAIERADVVFLVIDAKDGLTDQDARLADLAFSRHKPLAIVVNKWDLVENKEANTARDYADAIRAKLKTMAFVPVLFVSALTNQRVHKLMGVAEELATKAGQRVSTAKLNELLQRVVNEHTPALIRSYTKRIKFYYATQVRTNPPTIVVFCNVADEIQESYKRYMANRFRSELGFGDVPIRLIFRDKQDVKERKARYEDQPGA